MTNISKLIQLAPYIHDNNLKIFIEKTIYLNYIPNKVISTGTTGSSNIHMVLRIK